MLDRGKVWLDKEVLKMYWLIILLLVIIFGGIYGFVVFTIARKRKRKAVHDFNSAAGDLHSAQKSLNESVTKAEELLRSVKEKDISDPILLKKLRFILDTVKKSIGSDPPKMKTELYDIRTQTQHIRSQVNSLWKLYAEIVDTIYLVTESQNRAAQSGRLIVALSVVHPGMGIGFPVYALNPENGAEALIASFKIPENSYNHFQTDSTLFLPVASEPRREWFSKDFSKMAATKVFNKTNEYHAGWIDADGCFFDVTEALGLQSKNTSSCHAVGFSGDLFGYYQGSPSDNDYYYLPVNNISSDALQKGDVRCVGRPYDKDGSLLSGQDEKLYSHQVTSWIDETRCIVNDHKDSSVIVDTKSQSSFNYLSGKTGWNGVVNPTRDKIAFMSRPNDSKKKSGELIDIYITPISGGKPEKTAVYSAFVEGVGHSYMYDSSWESLFYWTLIDWC